MSGPQVYGLHGLRVRSPVPLAGFSLPSAGHDVDVRWTEWKPVPGEAPPGRLVAALGNEGAYAYVATADPGGGSTLRVPSLCDFAVDESRTSVDCLLDPSADPELVALLVSGLLVAFLLGLEGHCVLHASAVELNGRALAFAGPSGAGKSTLAALVCATGARLVSDDVLRLSLQRGVACVSGSPHLRLRPRSSWALDHFPARPPTSVTVDARLAAAPPTPEVTEVPLDVILLPRLTQGAAAIELRPLSRAAAVPRLAAVTRVAGWADRSVLAAQFRSMALVTAGVRVVDAVVPWGPHAENIAGPLVDVLAGAE